MISRALIFWTTHEGREGWFIKDGERQRTPVYPVQGPSEDAGDHEIYDSLRRPENKEALSLARLRGRADIKRRYIDPEKPCARCGKPVGEAAIAAIG